MQASKFHLIKLAALIAASAIVSACSTTATSTVTSTSAPVADAQKQIEHDVNATLERLYSTAPDSRELIKKANGVLVFPNVIAAGYVIGGQYGDGQLRVHGRTAGNYNLASLSVGLQIGAQSKAVVLLFMTQEALDKFRQSEGWAAGADASVAVLKVGVNGAIDVNSTSGPVLAFVLTNAGLMANLTLEGTKISRVH